jgi:hypothetical protein
MTYAGFAGIPRLLQSACAAAVSFIVASAVLEAVAEEPEDRPPEQRDKILATCKATKTACAYHVHEGVGIYRKGEPKTWARLHDIIYSGGGADGFSAVFSADGKYLLVNSGTGSAGHDFNIYVHRSGLTFESLKDVSIRDRLETMAFHLAKESEPTLANRVLDHSSANFVGWAGPHLARVELTGRGYAGEEWIEVDGWQGLFNLDTQKVIALPAARNVGKITHGPRGGDTVASGEDNGAQPPEPASAIPVNKVDPWDEIKRAIEKGDYQEARRLSDLLQK